MTASIVITASIEDGYVSTSMKPSGNMTDAEFGALLQLLDMQVRLLKEKAYQGYCEGVAAANMKQPETPEAPQGDLFGGSDESL